MISSKSLTIFPVLALLFCSSCQYFQNSANSNTSTNQTVVSEFENNEPFATKEPEIYQAEIIEKSEDNEISKTFIARSKERLFIKTDNLATLKLDSNKSYLINFAKKVYFENEAKVSATSESNGENLQDFLTTEWLNQQTEAKFENLGTENGLNKFVAKFDASEILVLYDENLKLPIKQEFYSIEGEQKNLTYSLEIQNLKLITDETFFEIPKDFRKVSQIELQQSLFENE
jgi:hypothetical protein